MECSKDDIALAKIDSAHTRIAVVEDGRAAADSAATTAADNKAFSSLSAFGFSFAVINSWVVCVVGLGSGLISGGPSALVWGFVYATLSNLALTLSHSEIFAVFPTAGGQYHWAAMLSPPRYKASISWFTGALNVIALWLGAATVGYLSATLFISIALVNTSSWAPTAGQEYAVFVGVTVAGPLLSVAAGPRINRAVDTGLMLLSILGAAAIFVTLLATARPKASASFVFGGLFNATGWDSMVIAWLLGILQSAFAFLGFDMVYHISEEMDNPRRQGPRVLILCIVISGLSGLAMLLACLFAVDDYDTVVGTSYGLAYAQICLDATKSKAATTVFLLVPAILLMNSARGICLTCARVLKSLGRDRALPFSPAFQVVRFGEPVYGLLLSVGVAAVCGLVQLGSASAFSSLLGASTIAFQITYIIPVVLLLLGGRQRLDKYMPGRTFSLGRWAAPVNLVACFFVLESSIVYCFPASMPVTASSMNYVVVFVGGFMAILAVVWFTWAKKRFPSPDERAIWAISCGEAVDGELEVVGRT